MPRLLGSLKPLPPKVLSLLGISELLKFIFLSWYLLVQWFHSRPWFQHSPWIHLSSLDHDQTCSKCDHGFNIPIQRIPLWNIQQSLLIVCRAYGSCTTILHQPDVHTSNLMDYSPFSCFSYQCTLLEPWLPTNTRQPWHTCCEVSLFFLSLFVAFFNVYHLSPEPKSQPISSSLATSSDILSSNADFLISSLHQAIAWPSLSPFQCSFALSKTLDIVLPPWPQFPIAFEPLIHQHTPWSASHLCSLSTSNTTLFIAAHISTMQLPPFPPHRLYINPPSGTNFIPVGYFHCRHLADWPVFGYTSFVVNTNILLFLGHPKPLLAQCRLSPEFISLVTPLDNSPIMPSHTNFVVVSYRHLVIDTRLENQWPAMTLQPKYAYNAGKEVVSSLNMEHNQTHESCLFFFIFQKSGTITDLLC